MKTIHQRACIACDKPIAGRSDKKFCNDYCRNEHNNSIKANSTNLMRNINHALARNRRIIQSCLCEGEKRCRAKRERLITEGFIFKYFTHTHTTQKGSTYYYCYDTGYTPLDNEWYLLVKRKE